MYAGDSPGGVVCLCVCSAGESSLFRDKSTFVLRSKKRQKEKENTHLLLAKGSMEALVPNIAQPVQCKLGASLLHQQGADLNIIHLGTFPKVIHQGRLQEERARAAVRGRRAISSLAGGQPLHPSPLLRDTHTGSHGTAPYPTTSRRSRAHRVPS